GLARDAERVPLANAAPSRVMHQHRLDERAVIETMEELLRQPAVGLADIRIRHRVEAEPGVERLAQGGRQRPDRGGGCHPAVLPDGVRDLPGAIARLAAGLDPGHQLVRRLPAETGSEGLRIDRRHSTMLLPTTLA